MIRSAVTWRSSIFIRLLLTFLLIIVPIYLLVINIINWSRNTLREEILSSMKYQSSFYLNNLDQDIQRIKNQQFDCSNDEDINNLANAADLMNDYDRTKATTRIQNRLTALKNSSIYIKDVNLHILPMNRTINSLGGRISSIYEFSESGFSISDYMDVNRNYPIIYRDDRLILTAIFPSMNLKKKAPSFIIDIELSEDALKDALVQFDNYKGSGSVLANVDKRFIIASDDSIDKSKYFKEFIKNYDSGTNSKTAPVEINENKYLMIYITSDYSGLTLFRYLPENEVFQSINRFKQWFWLLSLLSMVIIAIYFVSSYKLIHKPLHELVKSFKMVKNGQLDVKIEHAQNDEFGYLYSRFNEMMDNLKSLINQVYNQKILTQKAELKQLQSQINPHFLYNSYFLLHRMVKQEDKGNAIRFSKLMGAYLQFITRSGEDKVPLCKEVEHARIYTEIQAIRFEGRIKVEFESLPEEFSGFFVPKLILQPIIENAFEHGLENKRENGYLRIWFETRNDGFAILVEDNGEEMTDIELDKLQESLICAETAKENTGIININKRIHLVYGENSGITASRGSTGGLRMCIGINTNVYDGGNLKCTDF